MKYTIKDWTKDKLFIARLIRAKRYTDARTWTQKMSLVAPTDDIRNYMNGMLFVLDMLEGK